MEIVAKATIVMLMEQEIIIIIVVATKPTNKNNTNSSSSSLQSGCRHFLNSLNKVLKYKYLSVNSTLWNFGKLVLPDLIHKVYIAAGLATPVMPGLQPLLLICI